MCAAGLLLSAVCAFHVVDGDTVRLGTETIRLVGCDAPETHHAKCGAERRLGEVASTRLRDLLCAPGTNVVIDRGERPRLDRYRRMLARIFVDGQDVADLMIEAGLARHEHPLD